MDIAGYSKTTATSEVVGPLKEEITERAGMMLAINTPKAAFGIIDVLDDPSFFGCSQCHFGRMGSAGPDWACKKGTG